MKPHVGHAGSAADAESASSALMHEIRNQLAVARANLEACIDGKFEPTVERLQSIAQSLEQLEALLEGLRGLRPPSVEPAKPRRINVCVLLQGEFRAMEPLAAQKRIVLSVTRCADVNHACEHFYGDPARVGQIVKNVVLNAVRFTPDGGAISIDCSRAADELQVTISDSGPGVSVAERERIFEPGYRGAAAAGKPGSGYGLAVVKRLVEEQGGSVSVAADHGRGATFTVRLPGTPETFAGASP